MRVAIAGTGRLGTGLLGALRESRHEVVAVLQNGRTCKGVRRALSPAAGRHFGGARHMAGRARALGLPIFWIDRMDERELAPLRELDLDLLLVGGFSIILKAPLLNLPRIGCLNTHSSLLPRHRGPNPFTAVILAGETETGVSFHVMEEGIDTGDIVDQTAFPLTRDETMMSVYRRACDVAEERVVAVLDVIAAEGLQGVPQAAAEASYDPKAKAADARIRWDAPAVEIDRLVRAMVPSPMPWFPHQGRKVKVMRVHYDAASCDAAPGTVIANQPRAVIATGQGTVTLRSAYTNSLFPWPWPTAFDRPVAGSVLEGEDG